MYVTSKVKGYKLWRQQSLFWLQDQPLVLLLWDPFQIKGEIFFNEILKVPLNQLIYQIILISLFFHWDFYRLDRNFTSDVFDYFTDLFFTNKYTHIVRCPKKTKQDKILNKCSQE